MMCKWKRLFMWSIQNMMPLPLNSLQSRLAPWKHIIYWRSFLITDVWVLVSWQRSHVTMKWDSYISTIQMKNGGWWAYVSENLLLFKSKPPSCILTHSHVRPVGDYFPSFCLALFYSIVEVFEDYVWFYLCWKIIIKHQLWEPYGNQVPLWVSCTHKEESLLPFSLNNLSLLFWFWGKLLIVFELQSGFRACEMYSSWRASTWQLERLASILCV